MWNESFIYVKSIIHTCETNHADMRNESFVRLTSIHSYVWHNSWTWWHDSTRLYAWHGILICFAWLIHMCGVTHSYVCHDTLKCVVWRIHMLRHMCGITGEYVWWLIHMWGGMTHAYVSWLDEFMCVTCFIHTCDMTHSYVRHDAWICVMTRRIMCATCFIDRCDMTHSYVRHDAFICVKTRRIHVCDMFHSYMWHDSFIRVAWRIHMFAMIHLHVWHDSFTCATWLVYGSDTAHSHA